MARQIEILGMKVQREYKGPAARLVELLDSGERNYVGIVFYEQYKNHSALTNSLDGLMGFLQCPVARGITPLHTYGYEEGAFIYETGRCKSVAELIRQASDLGLSPGPRAGLELMVQSLEILQGALRIAEEYAIFSHGGLTPWRLMIRSDGKLQIIGFAVPQVEVLDYKDNPDLTPSEDSFRYAPPERMEMDAMEDFSSDLFAMGLIGFEMMTTRPMYDGSISAIQESAQRADVSMRLNQAKVSGWLDQHTHDFLDQCLRLDSDDRFVDLRQAIKAGKSLLRNQHLKGMSLFDLMAACSQQILRQSQDVETLDAATAMFDRNALAPEILEMEAERKRQKLKEVTLGEPLTPSVDKEQNRASGSLAQSTESPSTEKASPANLLDLLRQSSISKPDLPEIKTPPPTERPKSGLKNDLLSALQSSISKPVESVLPPEPSANAPTTNSVDTADSSTSAVQSEQRKSKLNALFTPATRTPEPPTPQELSIASSPGEPNSSPTSSRQTGTANKLASLLSQPSRSRTENVNNGPSASQSTSPQEATQPKSGPTPPAEQKQTVTQPVDGQEDGQELEDLRAMIEGDKNTAGAQSQIQQSVQPPSRESTIDSSLPVFGDPLEETLEETLGETLGDLPEEASMSDEAMSEDSWDDGATMIMTRPTVPTNKGKSKETNNNVPTPKQKAKVPASAKNTPKAVSSSRSTPQNTSTSNALPTRKSKEKEKVGPVSMKSSQTERIPSTVSNKDAQFNTPQQFGDLEPLFGAPIPVQSRIPTVNAQKYKISLGSGRGNIKQVCSPEITVSQLVAVLLLNRLLPVRMDPSGCVTSCYRVLEKGLMVSGRRRLKTFSGQTLMLGSVPSRTILLPVEVHTPDGIVRFNTPVNWVVSMGSIIDYMVSWLRLPVGGWTVQIGEHSMDAHDVLFDIYEEGASYTMVFTRTKQ